MNLIHLQNFHSIDSFWLHLSINIVARALFANGFIPNAGLISFPDAFRNPLAVVSNKFAVGKKSFIFTRVWG